MSPIRAKLGKGNPEAAHILRVHAVIYQAHFVEHCLLLLVALSHRPVLPAGSWVGSNQLRAGVGSQTLHEGLL